MFYTPFMGETNAELVENLVRNKIIKSTRVRDVMLKVDRGDFVDSPMAYEDQPLPIGYQATISAPHMHAHALELLHKYLQPGKKVLDVGSGSGYLTACFAYLVTDEKDQIFGKAVGIEHIQELAKLSIENIKKHHKNLFDQGFLKVIAGDARMLTRDSVETDTFDCIHVGAAINDKKSFSNLLHLLNVGGVLIGPVSHKVTAKGIKNGRPFNLKLYCESAVNECNVEHENDYESQDYVKVTRNSAEEFVQESLFGVRYVPLTSEQKQRHRLY